MRMNYVSMCILVALMNRFIPSLKQMNVFINDFRFNSVQFSHSVVSDSLRPHESQHARPPCPSPSPEVHSNSRPSSR